MRAVDIAGCGHTSTNIEEVSDELADPDCGWEYGSATVWRGTDLVGAALVFDGLVDGRGWMIDVYARPGDPRARAILGALIDAALREGRYRWDALYMDPEVPLPTAKVRLLRQRRRAARRARAARVRRGAPLLADEGGPLVGRGPEPRGSQRTPRGSARRRQRAAGRVRDSGRSGTTSPTGGACTQPVRLAFLDHFDFTPLEFDAWREHHAGRDRGPDPVDRCRARRARSSATPWDPTRYASEDCGYVASIGVLREHRGHGVARALLRARMADDVAAWLPQHDPARRRHQPDRRDGALRVRRHGRGQRVRRLPPPPVPLTPAAPRRGCVHSRRADAAHRPATPGQAAGPGGSPLPGPAGSSPEVCRATPPGAASARARRHRRAGTARARRPRPRRGSGSGRCAARTGRPQPR